MVAGKVVERRVCSHSKSEKRRHTVTSLRTNCGSVVVVETWYLVCLSMPDPNVVGFVTVTRMSCSPPAAPPTERSGTRS